MELKEVALGIVRHLMTYVGGLLVANGLLADADVQTLSGAVAALVGLGLSIYNKKKAE